MRMKPIPEQNLKRLQYLSTFLRELRLNNGLTQQELSQNLNLHRNTIQNAENVRNITLLSLFELADTLDISLKELFSDFD
jgi:transcriptional regulator with XRE-family HTH domain